MIVLQYLLGFIAFVFILGLIVLVHEAGHFIFARRAGILCYEFAIGMGPVIWQKKKGKPFIPFGLSRLAVLCRCRAKKWKPILYGEKPKLN